MSTAARAARTALVAACVLASTACRLLPQYNTHDAGGDGGGADVIAPRDVTSHVDVRRPDVPPPPDPCRVVTRTIHLPSDPIEGNFPIMPGPITCRCDTYRFGVGVRYDVTVDEPTIVKITEPSGGVDRGIATLSLRRECSVPDTEFACARVPYDLRAMLLPGTYTLLIFSDAVAGLGTGTMYRFRVDSFSAAPNATCAQASPLVPGPTSSLHGVGLYNAGPSMPPCLGSYAASTSVPLASVYYAVRVPPGQRLTVAMPAAQDVEQALTVALHDGCDDSLCLAVSPPMRPGALPYTWWDNRGDAARTVVIEARGSSHYDTSFDLDVSLSDTPAQPNFRCAAATALDNDTQLHDELLGAAPVALLPTPLCGRVGNAQSLYYQIALRPGWSLRARASVAQGDAWAPTVTVTRGCTPDCAAVGGLEAVDDGAGHVAVETAAFNDDPLATPSYIVTVGAVTRQLTGRFDLAVTARPPAPNAACSNATALGDGTVLPDEDPLRGRGKIVRGGSGVDRGDVVVVVCGDALGTLFYSATVPPQSALVVTATPAVADNASRAWAIASSCDTIDCRPALAGRAARGVSYSTLVNHGDSPASYVLAHITEYTGAPRSPAPCEVRAVSRPLPTNGTCDAARGVNGGTRLDGELVAAGGPASADCAVFPGEVGLYYRVRVEPSVTLTVLATPHDNAAPRVELHDVCGAPMACLAIGRPAGGAGQVRLDYTNRTLVARDAIVMVAVTPDSAPVDLTFSLF